MDKLKLFPLGLVAYPTKVIPLHIFEDRYKTLINECLSLDKEFGMVFSMDNKLVDFGCSLSISEVIKTYSNGEMDIITHGERIFKVHTETIENDLHIGQIEFQKDITESNMKIFDALKEKYLQLLLQLGLGHEIERHMQKTLSFELIEHIQLPHEVELLLISTRSEIERLTILDEIFDQILEKGIDKINNQVYQS